MFSAFSNLFPGNIGCKNKNPSQRISERDHVLRTGIEPHMIISKLGYLYAVLQAVKEAFCKFLLTSSDFRNIVLGISGFC